MKPSHLNNEIVLIVNHNEFIAKMIKAQLQRHAYPSNYVDSYEAAAIFIKEEHVDLVLLDADLPITDGFRALQLLRERHPAAELPVIMLTSPNRKEQIAKSLQLGANDFITKPLDLNVAIARIEIQMQLRRAAQAVRESEERYALAIAGTQDGIWDWDFVHDQVFYSSRWKAMLGYKESEIGSSIDDWFSRIHADDRQRVNRALNDYLSHKTSQFAAEYRMLHRDSRYRWCLARATARFGVDGSALRLVGSQADISRRGIHDDLTGLPKRDIFLERVANATSRVRDDSKPFLAIVEFMIRRFQEIRTSYGEQLADQLLLLVVDRIQDYLDPSETLAQLEAANFVVLQDDLADPCQSDALVARLQDAFCDPFIVAGNQIRLGIRCGIASAEPPVVIPEDVLQQAHVALINATRVEKAYEVFNPDMRDSVIERVELEMELRSALNNNELYVVYQPKVDIQSDELVGAEVLLRWKHPSLGEISPARFIPIAESCGEIGRIGQWVLRTACEQAQAWRDRGLRDFRIAVNFSAIQLRDQHLPHLIQTIFTETGFDPHFLDIELTESVLLDNLGTTRNVLDQLKEIGCGLHVDDFGTGYSSLSYLTSFPIDGLKIDQSFVKGIEQEAQKHTIVDSIVAMARHLGRMVIAEGVETSAQLDMLREMGCNEAQGFYLGVPMAAKAMEEVLVALQTRGVEHSAP